MSRCRHRWPWATEGTCQKRGLIAGRCIEHLLYEMRWTWYHRDWRFELDFSNMNRPYLMVSEERPIEYVSLCYGTDGSDPVLSIGWERGSAERRAEWAAAKAAEQNGEVS